MQRALAIFILVLSAVRIPGCKQDAPVEVNLDPLVQQALYDTTSSYYTDFSKYPKNIADLPIGIFGLGCGTADMLETALALDSFDNITGEAGSDRIRDFAGENFICYTALSDADNIYDANGNLDVHDAAIKHTLFLVGDKCAEGEKERAKIILAAGNITRRTGLDDIRQMLDISNSGVKIISVAEEGVKSLLDELADKPMLNYTVGLIADSLAIASGAYPQMMKDISTERGLKNVAPLACQRLDAVDSVSTADIRKAFAAMVESHYAAGKPSPICALVTDIDLDQDALNVIQDVINNYRSKRIGGDYPYRAFVNDRLIFINPLKCAAQECYRTLRADNNLALRIDQEKVFHYTDLPM